MTTSEFSFMVYHILHRAIKKEAGLCKTRDNGIQLDCHWLL